MSMIKPIKKRKIEPFYPKMENLGIEYSIAFIVEEYFNKYMFPEKDRLTKVARSELKTKNLYAYTKIICTSSVFRHHDDFSKYVYRIVDLLKGDSNSSTDVGKATALFENTLAEQHLVRWFKEIDWTKSS